MGTLFLTSHDLARYRNSRFRQMVRYLAPALPRPVVVYRVHPLGEKTGFGPGNLFRIRVERTSPGGIPYLGLDPLLNYPMHLGARVLAVRDRFAPAPRPKRALREVLGLLGTARWWAALVSLEYLFRRHLRGQCFEVAVVQGALEGFYALRLKRRGVVGRLVYDDHDYEAGFIESSALARRMMKAIEDRALLGADLVVSVGQLLAERRRRELGLRALVIPNGADLSRFRPPESLSGRLRAVVYAGYLGSWSGLEVLVSALGHLPEAARPRLLLFGHREEGYAEELRGLVRELGLGPWVSFGGYLPYEELPGALRRGEVGWAASRPVALRRYAFPMKVVEYAACGLAVLATEGTEAGETVQREGIGEAVAFEPGAVARALAGLGEAPGRLQARRKAACAWARGLDWKTLMHRYLTAITSATSP